MRQTAAGLLLIFLLVPAASRAAPALRPFGLTCEYRVDPAGIGETLPRLGWELAASDPAARDLRQTAYRILVASSPERLARGEGDVWDSGKVMANATDNIAFGGRPLASGEPCWWQVLVWDQDGEASAWSPAARWSMGLLHRDDWKALWIGLDADPSGGETAEVQAQRQRLSGIVWAEVPVAPSRDAPRIAWIRRGLTLPPDRPLARASLLLTPDQVCVVSVNGRSVGRIARWDRAVPFDLKAALVPGDNRIGLRIEQRDGYPPAVLGELELGFADGGWFRLPIGRGWHYFAEGDGPATPGPEWDRSAPGLDPWPELALLPNGRSPWGTPQDATLVLPPAPFLRKTFELQKPVRRAVLYATALGLYETYLNGERIARDYFTPGWTDYRRRVDCQAYDVTGLLRPGANALGAILGDGWYAGTVGFTGRRHLYGGEPRFAAQLEIEYADGSRSRIATDETWHAAFGPVRYADLLQGCAYDERLAWPDWAKPGFAAAGWLPVTTGLRPVGNDSPLERSAPVIEPARVDPVRVSDEVPARAVTEPVRGRYVVDFGQNLVGWIRLKLGGRRGQRIQVRYGEMLNPNGTLYTSNLRGAAATDVYWLGGDGQEALEPHFTFHGFRYAEITGLDRYPDPGSATAIVVHSALARTGHFACSDPRLNRLYQNIIWSQKGNYLEVPTDCPQRDERLGWTGDAQFFIPTAIFNFQVASFIERWLTTLATDDQGGDGTFPVVAPSIGRPPQAVTAWGDAAITCTYALWHAYDDTRVIERHFDELVRYLDWLRVDAAQRIATVGGYGDWLNKGGGARTEVIDTAYYAHFCDLMEQMASAIGRTADAKRYGALRREVTAAFQQAFLLPDGGIRDSDQTGYALAFTMGLIPPELRAKAAGRFVDTIASRDWHLATGFIGTPRLLPALHEAGRDDVAYALLLQDTYPSWLFQVKNGATTMWERWDGWTPDQGFQTVDMNSFNHYAFGAVGEYLYRFVAGIDTDGPGFRKIVLQPAPSAGLTWARAEFDAPTGRIASGWKLENGVLKLDVAIPPNVTATLRLPAGAPGPREMTLGSGNYHFEIPLLPAPGANPAAASRPDFQR